MPHIASLMPRVLATSLALASLASVAWAQPAPTVRIRGTIEAVDGPMLSMLTRKGSIPPEDSMLNFSLERVEPFTPKPDRTKYSAKGFPNHPHPSTLIFLFNVVVFQPTLHTVGVYFAAVLILIAYYPFAEASA